ncbi:MAG: SDR family oxidoreductase [Clostridiales bacterium]|nr:SDR family oxidoreductase [Clostridiales bacterium]
MFVSSGASEMAYTIEKNFLLEGACVVLVDISPERLQSTAAELASALDEVGIESGNRIRTYQADITSLTDMESAAAFTVEEFGRIDIMLNCAGIPLGRMGTMQDVAYGALYLCSDESSWITGEVLDINGGIYCKG